MRSVPVHQPTAFFWWWFAFDSYVAKVSTVGIYIAASGGVLAIGLSIAMSVWRAREAPTIETFEGPIDPGDELGL